MNELRYVRMTLTALLMAATALVSIGCIDDEGGDGGKTDTKILVAASIERLTAPTKLAVNEPSDGKCSIVWTTGEEMTIVSKNMSGRAKLVLSSSAGSDTGFFELKDGSFSTSQSFAVYPYSETAAVAGETLTVHVGQQVAGSNDNNITNGSMPMVTEVRFDANMPVADFRHLCGLVKITLTANTAMAVRKMVLRDLKGNMLWGRCDIPLADGISPDCKRAKFSNGSSSVEMLWDTPVTIFKVPVTCYFAVPAGALDGGFELTVYEYDETATDKTGRACGTVVENTDKAKASRATLTDAGNYEVTPL